jgi:hypothetical protein
VFSVFFPAVTDNRYPAGSLSEVIEKATRQSESEPSAEGHETHRSGRELS